MGYATFYKLTTTPPNAAAEKAVHDLYDGEIGQALADGEDMKWYDHETDLRKISTQFPDVVFHLHGVGEDYGDIWEKHFCNGKMQVCKARITFPKYDPRKLK